MFNKRKKRNRFLVRVDHIRSTYDHIRSSQGFKDLKTFKKQCQCKT